MKVFVALLCGIIAVEASKFFNFNILLNMLLRIYQNYFTRISKTFKHCRVLHNKSQTNIVKLEYTTCELRFCELILLQITALYNGMQNVQRINESLARMCCAKKVVLKLLRNSQEKTCARVWRPATFLKRNSTTSVFLWILRNFKNTIFIEHLWMAAS